MNRRTIEQGNVKFEAGRSAKSLAGTRRRGGFPPCGWPGRFVVVLLLAVLGGCGRDAPAPRQVILIMLDAARPDRFSCYDYGRPTTPEMDRLAAEGIVFRRHYAQATSTRASLPALIYSRYFCAPIFPNSRHVPYSRPSDLFRRPDEAQVSLPMVYEVAGFKTAAITAHDWTGKETPFAAEFTEMHDLTPGLRDRKYGYPRAEYVIDYVIRWLEQNEGQDFFLYLHLMDTHFPHFFGKDAQRFFGADRYAADRFQEGGSPRNLAARLTKEDRRYLDALYDGSLRYTDRQIGRLVDFLRQQGSLRHTIIAITSDHGENLLEGPGDPATDGASTLSHGGPWFERVAHTPLILFAPGGPRGKDFPYFSEEVDVAPTLLALSGVPLPAGKSFDGVDLLPVLSGAAAAKEQVLVRRGIRTQTHKCLFRNGDKLLLGETAPDPQRLAGRLYDLEADPEERVNLFSSRPDLMQELLAQYRQNMMGRFRRFAASRTERQPPSAFAVGAEHMLTDQPLPTAQGQALPQGWCRIRSVSHGLLVSRANDQPLTIHFPLPDGTYQLAVKMQGKAVLAVDGVERELVEGRDMVDFGDVEVTGRTFRATIRPRAGGVFAVQYFGFTPPAAAAAAGTDDQRLRRLRTLGYVE